MAAATGIIKTGNSGSGSLTLVSITGVTADGTGTATIANGTTNGETTTGASGGAIKAVKGNTSQTITAPAADVIIDANATGATA
jgi:hypothetical protein